MKKQLTWQLKLDGFGIPLVSPLSINVDLRDPFFDALFDNFSPNAYLIEIEGTALAAAVKSGHQETVTNQPDNGLGIVSETATPMGNGRFVVEYEVENE